MRRFLVFGLFFLLISCQHKTYSPLTYEGKMLEWGTGGGFTGAVSTWCLLDNGRIFKSEDNGKTYQEVTKITRTASTQFFDNFTTLGLRQMKLDEPGNKYYFLVLREKEGVHKLVWGYKDLANKVPAILHKNLMHIIKVENQ